MKPAMSGSTPIGKPQIAAPNLAKDETLPAEQPNRNPNGSTGPKGIPIERILAMKAKGLTLSQMAKLLDCSETNIKKRMADLDIETLTDFTDCKASIYDIVERKHLRKLLDGDSKRPMEDMTVAAIAGDKGRVIRGLATQIVEHREISIDLNRAYEQLRQGADRPVDNSTYQPKVVDLPPMDSKPVDVSDGNCKVNSCNVL